MGKTQSLEAFTKESSRGSHWLLPCRSVISNGHVMRVRDTGTVVNRLCRKIVQDAMFPSYRSAGAAQVGLAAAMFEDVQ